MKCKKYSYWRVLAACLGQSTFTNIQDFFSPAGFTGFVKITFK
ncbi:hypothetical protein MuYL_1653 [Mucilaginibacter xinganensis]|uniref:Uncharacterized protein n=1 Tax=Mucilaginibacter xinganensis TaxID=1234841 RepID=A0A223NUH9_9SPHI|nr:hypothetical protein MuYL_1653 [Mucilaginibacter xinganensis]